MEFLCLEFVEVQTDSDLRKIDELGTSVHEVCDSTRNRWSVVE